MTQATTTIKCTRCAGTGDFQWMTSQGWAQGTCFRCGGSGIDPEPVKAVRKIERTAAQRARDEAQIAAINERKAAAKAQAELDNAIRWAKESYRDINREIAKAEATGDTLNLGIFRDTLLPLVIKKLEDAVELVYGA